MTATEAFCSIGYKRALYAFISFATPIGAFLATADPMTGRKVCALLVAGLIAAATTDRAFLDPSQHTPRPTQDPPKTP